MTSRAQRLGGRELGHLGLHQPAEQPVQHQRAVELHRVVAGPVGQLLPILIRHLQGLVQGRGDRGRVVDRHDQGRVADRLADPAGVGGDHRTAAGQHLLHQGDAEGLDELRAGLAGQRERRAAGHQR